MNIVRKFTFDFNTIEHYYDFLVQKTKNHEYVGVINEWLIDNFYLLVEYKNVFIENKKYIRKHNKLYLDLYNKIEEFVIKNNYNISYKTLCHELKAYQNNNKTFFTYKELSKVKDVLYLIYVHRLRLLCEDEHKKMINIDKINTFIDNHSDNDIKIKDIISKDEIKKNHHFIFELNYRLRELGSKSSYLFKELNKLLEDNNVSLKEIINDEYKDKIKNDILVSNIFNDLREFVEVSTDDLYEKVSKVEKLFLTDEIYSMMTPSSKKLYRDRLVKLAKKKKMSEYDYLESLFKKVDGVDYHIGFQLFKNKNKLIDFYIYLIMLIILSFGTSFVLSRYFLESRVLSFIIIFIPIFQLYLKIINEILIRNVKPNILPKIDFSKGINSDNRTMVVIPTIISDKDKIKTMFDQLESFYIMNNKTDNLYFTLLGDVKSSSKEVEDYDKDISKYGQKYAKDLNKKYDKDLFFFVYRKRKYNNSEDEYLGYERKRGALLQFNKVLLNEIDKVTSEEYYNVNMLLNKKLNIKYVITLDTDTRFVLNTALNLVGTMAHPLNKPILNKEGTKVIKGYALMQPRVSIDIEDTNSSLYSQIFAGIGGFDTYTSVAPDVYQDSFGEGSFMGKGIYDLKTFDKVLYGALPDNKILSHDLLEGNYLRCAYISDIEVVDGFPSKFLPDMSRHSRWARGDTQIISWLGTRIRNRGGKIIKNPINGLGKFKILDNIVRMFLLPGLLLILLLSLIFSKYYLWWFGFVIFSIALPIIFFLRSKIYRENSNKEVVYYKNLFYGGRSILSRSYLVLSCLPYDSLLYMSAFFKSIYRLLISHKHLLSWLTADEAEKTIKDTLGNYIKNFIFNIIIGILLIIYFIISKKVLSLVLAFIFIGAPIAMYYVSRDLDKSKMELKNKEIDNVRELAKRTYMYFRDNLLEEYNYLIPDNYQDNREQKLDLRTSPTSIGYSLLALICGYELGIEGRDYTVDMMGKVLNTINSLKKWHGHLYNWYDIKTKEAMMPYFVSSLDSGNLIAALIVVREFLSELEENDLVNLCDKLINNTNFKRLYTKKDVFSIGYDSIEGKLSIYNYNKFASESRLTSYLAIALGDVPNKHWFCLDKSLTTHKGRKGLVSWSGTAFEYFMPYLFMKNYPNTLLDETYHFAYFCNKDYIESISRDLPWGISESAYNELDNSLNYKYRAFSTPYLKSKEDKDNRIVISPYSSLMMMEFVPYEVYKNINKLKKLEMYSKYGFYEAYDYDNKGVVKSYFAHHQGMSLVGLTNYLTKGCIKNYFHNNVNIKTYDILLKEKVQIKASIDMKMAKYKKYNYEKEEIQNDIRSFNYISYMPEVSVLSNKKYSLLMNDRGDSFSRYRTIQLNRYRKVSEQDYGLFLYIKDLDTNFIWSNTFAPMNRKADKYEIVFASDKIKYLRQDGDISTKTEIIVTKEHHSEIRKITFKNDSSETKHLELTTYTEPILSENMNDISHRVFNSMFLSSTIDKDTHSVIIKRKSREDANTNMYMFNRLVAGDSNYSYETERDRFIGRNNSLSNPIALNKELSNYEGDNLDPVISIRTDIEVKPYSSYEVFIVCGFGRSKEQINEIIKSYNTINDVDRATTVANVDNIIRTHDMQLSGDQMRTYNIMLNYLYQTTRLSVNEERLDLLRKNALGQGGLWKFGVTGDRPIILVDISDISDFGFISEILRCFEYYKNNSIFVDIIIINSENTKYKSIINQEIEDELYRLYTLNSFYHTPGSVTVIDSNNITREDRTLLNMVPRLKFVISDHRSLKEEVEGLQKKNTVSVYEKNELEDNIKYKNSDKLVFDNGYGGFNKSGNEYIIYNMNTPKPWSNIIANKNFGTIITNNGCGFTYGFNSSEFKISSWTNDMVTNDKSEGFRFNDKVFDPTKCIHGFGYSTLFSETEEFIHEICEFVPENDNVKIYLMKLTNKEDVEKEVKIDFYVNPVLGNFEEKTSRHILAEFINDDNYVKIRNVYSINYGDVNVFMSSNLKIDEALTSKILIKRISSNIVLKPNEEKTIVYSLGCAIGDSETLKLVKKYSKVDEAKQALKTIKNKWKKILGTVVVKSPDQSFDFMINGWYLYQTISSRILAKSGFYQVSGAFGYRDQLQDAMNISLNQPDYTRNQIIKNACHQFESGDVLHWWHDKNRFGLRSRYKDDYLWLVYATLYYIKVTGDKDILYEEIPYVIGDKLRDGEKEKGIIFTESKEKDSLLNHMLKAIDLSMNSMGKHHLPLMGGGDWNDGMNKVGIKGKGESVWLGFFLYDIIRDFISLVKTEKIDIDIDKYQKFNDNLKTNLNKYAWDGEWYLRAYFDNGDKLGSQESDEAKIDLISQSFSILSDVADKSRREKAITSVEKYLVDDDARIIKLLDPAFSKSLNNPGYIMSYPIGVRENGGQYTHSVSWYLMALIKSGYGDRAYRYFQMINPINRSINKNLVSSYEVEPYVIAADIYSAPGREGQGGWTWYTGSAGWFYRVGVQDILGIKKEKDTLRLEPHMPISWDNYRVKYTYMDTTYNIEVVKTNKDEVVLDGKKLKNNKIGLINDKSSHEITVYIKK